MAQVKEFIVYSATKAEFEAQVASGEVDNTQIGVIAETGEFWEKGNYHPLVDLEDYLKKTDAVELAKDLTGSLEATPEEFVFRASAGTKSIRDESAVIRRIKGNTSVWAQYADNPIFANGTSRWNRINTTLSIDTDGSLKVKHDIDGSQGFSQTFDDRHIPSGHKILVVIDYKRSASTSKELLVYLRKESHTGFDIGRITVSSASRRTDGIIITTTEPRDSVNIYPFIGGAVEYYTNVYSVNIFDLTAIFGAGNEPTTLAKFKELYPESYYPYCEPEVRSMRATGIETIGTNAFDKDDVVGGRIQADGSIVANDVYSIGTIEVLPNQQYYLKDVANGAYVTYSYALYDSNGKHLSNYAFTNTTNRPSNMSGRVTIPMNARYMKVCVDNSYLESSCVHLVHTGIQNGTYTPFEKHVRMLPDIATYFPDGMHGIGGVFDEINEENAVKRFGVVDLGSIDDYVYNGSAFRSFALSEIMRRTQTTTNYNENMICAGYDTFRGTQSLYKIEFTTNNGALWIKNPDYTDAALFKSAMSGVLLYYELAEPIVTPITEPLQLDYKVADFGTEKMLSDLPSSPFRADIVYQFNASDRIRDNGRNIERIENSMATMEDVENYMMQNMPTEAAPATQVVAYNVSDGSIAISPNIMYEYQYGIGVSQTFVFPLLVSITGDYEKVWMMRLPAIASSNNLSISNGVKWKDGIAPTFSEPVCLEIYLKKIGADEYIGEWKIYK